MIRLDVLSRHAIPFVFLFPDTHALHGSRLKKF